MMESLVDGWAELVRVAEDHPGFAAYLQAVGSVLAILIAEARIRAELSRRSRATLRFANQELKRLDAIEDAAGRALGASSAEFEVCFAELQALLLSLSALFGQVDVSQLPPRKHAAYLIMTKWAADWSQAMDLAIRSGGSAAERLEHMGKAIRSLSEALPRLRRMIAIASGKKGGASRS